MNRGYGGWLQRQPTDDSWSAWQAEGRAKGYLDAAGGTKPRAAGDGSQGFVRSVDTPEGDGHALHSDWPEIEPIASDLSLPQFPLETLPSWMAEMAGATAATSQTDVSMAALTVLGLASVPISNRFEASPRIWTERTIGLFTCSLADTGELKSSVFHDLADPLYRHEREVRDAGLPTMREQDHAREEAQARLSAFR
jgi:hypothetical protein